MKNLIIKQCTFVSSLGSSARRISIEKCQSSLTKLLRNILRTEEYQYISMKNHILENKVQNLTQVSWASGHEKWDDWDRWDGREWRELKWREWRDERDEQLWQTGRKQWDRREWRDEWKWRDWRDWQERRDKRRWREWRDGREWWDKQMWWTDRKQWDRREWRNEWKKNISFWSNY